MSSEAVAAPGESLADRFAAIWETGGPPPDLISFLATCPAATSSERLGVLLVDQRYRWRTGEGMPVEAYLRAVPELADHPEIVGELRQGESRLRHEWKETLAGPTTLIVPVEQTPRSEQAMAEPTETDLGADEATSPLKTRDSSGGTDDADFSLDPEIEAATATDESQEALLGTDRFAIQNRLGTGGMGVVHCAYDRERGEVVAIKTMRRIDPKAVYRFKQEFRTLADLSHPNLVNLYELVATDDVWFFTMELVEGIDFIRHVRSTADDPGETGDAADAPMTRAGEALGPEQIRRLRRAALQLAEGIAALHDAGKLHRDVKPRNVLVTARGRVVLLDFGLSADLGPSGHHDTSGEPIVGTAAYMAPEQGTERPVSAACDWYSVGVILYAALTGRLPFDGPSHEVLARKNEQEAPPPSARAAGVPADLDALCVELLRRDPAARPKGAAILARLAVAGEPTASGGSVPPACPSDPAPVSSAVSFLIGRERHCEALRSAFESVCCGRPETIFVSGRSGSGKSTLLQAFLDGLTGPDAAVVLAGRCYERESVPYKALDSVVDALSRYLKPLPAVEVRALLPADVSLLARVFPVLQRVDAVASAPRPAFEVPDQQELRRRAFAALRTLLERIGRDRPLVVVIDDLQWAEPENVALIADLVRPPDAPLMLLVGSFRSEDVATSPFLRSLLDAGVGVGVGAEPGDSSRQPLRFQELSVGALSQVESRSLALALLGRDDPLTLAEAHLIARESHGNPFFLDELVKHVQGGGGLTLSSLSAGAITLDEVLWGRIGRLPEDARRLLGIVAVSGRPIGQSLAFLAANLGSEGRGAVGLLRSGRLIRITGPAQTDTIEVYHDRIRETVVARSPAEVLRDQHRRLAEAMEATGRGDPESLAMQFQGAGELAKAGHYFELAADRAIASVAFFHAARLYRRALELRGTTGDRAETSSLNRKLGDALANSGRGGEAAQAYLDATAGASVAGVLELKRRATMQLLISGRVDEGFAALGSVLAALGMGMPSSPRRALLGLIVGRARLKLRGYGFRRRDTSQLSAEALTRIDLCWSAATGLSIIDPICGAEFQARGLLLALRAGEPYRVARALTLEAMHVSTAGGRGRRPFARLLESARELAEEVGHPHTQGLIPLASATAALMIGRWREAREAFDRAETIFRDRCTGVAWELDTVHNLALWAITHMGDLAELRRRCPVLLQEAQERGDLYAITTLDTYYMTIVRLADDDPAGALRELASVMARWSHRGFHVQHATALRAHAQIELYRGEGLAAWERIRRHGRSYSRSQLLRVQMLRIEYLELRARSALAAALATDRPRRLLGSARRDARRLERENEPWARALARLVRAGIAAALGERLHAIEHLTAAIEQLEAVEMQLHAAAARWRLGALLGGAAGQNLVSRAEGWMRTQAIRDPVRITSVYAPGFPDAITHTADSGTLSRI